MVDIQRHPAQDRIFESYIYGCKLPGFEIKIESHPADDGHAQAAKRNELTVLELVIGPNIDILKL